MRFSFLVLTICHLFVLQQCHEPLLEYSGTDASEHMVSTAPLQNDVLYSIEMQELGQQQARGAATDNRYLSLHTA